MMMRTPAPPAKDGSSRFFGERYSVLKRRSDPADGRGADFWGFPRSSYAPSSALCNAQEMRSEGQHSQVHVAWGLPRRLYWTFASFADAVNQYCGRVSATQVTGEPFRGSDLCVHCLRQSMFIYPYNPKK